MNSWHYEYFINVCCRIIEYIFGPCSVIMLLCNDIVYNEVSSKKIKTYFPKSVSQMPRFPLDNIFPQSSPYFLYSRNMMILRVHGDEFIFPPTLHQVAPRIPQMNMMKVHIPFTFKLLETSKSSYSGRHYNFFTNLFNNHIWEKYVFKGQYTKHSIFH